MRVSEIMTADPVCCSPETPLQDVAKLMTENDCGCIPVVDEENKPVGAITDRDICCRSVAQGRNPLELTAADCMTAGCVTVTPDTSVEDCCELLEGKQIRRAVVIDDAGRCCGMVAQSDIAQHHRDLAGAVVQAVSQPTSAPSNVTA